MSQNPTSDDTQQVVILATLISTLQAINTSLLMARGYSKHLQEKSSPVREITPSELASLFKGLGKLHAMIAEDRLQVDGLISFLGLEMRAYKKRTESPDITKSK